MLDSEYNVEHDYAGGYKITMVARLKEEGEDWVVIADRKFYSGSLLVGTINSTLSLHNSPTPIYSETTISPWKRCWPILIIARNKMNMRLKNCFQLLIAGFLRCCVNPALRRLHYLLTRR